MSWSEIAGESAGRENIYVAIESGKPKRVHALLATGEEPRSFWSHFIESAKQSVRCPGKNVCPACKEGISARMVHAMNVYDYTEKSVRILDRGNQVYQSIKLFYESNSNNLDNIDIVIKSTGKGRNTNYVVASLPVDKNAPDFESLERHDLDEICKPNTPQEIKDLLSSGDFSPDKLEEEVEFPDEPTNEKSTMPTGKYRGKTIEDIAKIDIKYVQWVADNFDDPDLVGDAKAILNKKVIKNEGLNNALALVEKFQEKGGDIKQVASIMRKVAAGKKMVLRDFTDGELAKFSVEIEDLVESPNYDKPEATS